MTWTQQKHSNHLIGDRVTSPSHSPAGCSLLSEPSFDSSVCLISHLLPPRIDTHTSDTTSDSNTHSLHQMGPPPRAALHTEDSPPVSREAVRHVHEKKSIYILTTYSHSPAALHSLTFARGSGGKTVTSAAHLQRAIRA